MKRRDVAQAAALIAGGSLLAGRSALAGEKSAPEVQGMKGIVYSEAMQGKWKGKAGGHVPRISVDGRKVTVETRHGMSPAHYIVRHTLVGPDGVVLGEKTFSGTDAKALSVFELPSGFSGRIVATSFCNLHDFWISEAEV